MVKACPKRVREAKPKKYLKRKKRIRKGPTAEGRQFWHDRRISVYKRSDGRCEWSEESLFVQERLATRCAYRFSAYGGDMDCAHVEPLKTGGSRFNPRNPRNELSNLLGLCRKHHEQMEAERLDRLAREKGLKK